MEFPSRDTIEMYWGKLVCLLCEGDKLEILRHEAKNQWEEGKRRRELGCSHVVSLMFPFGPTVHLLVVDYAILLGRQVFVVLVFLV
ncbi:hypothetical protein T09_10362 [Trichinella sp. T9]|nr:hypothetical protein T09_10362 [Trichinella sp. T9]